MLVVVGVAVCLARRAWVGLESFRLDGVVMKLVPIKGLVDVGSGNSRKIDMLLNLPRRRPTGTSSLIGWPSVRSIEDVTFKIWLESMGSASAHRRRGRSRRVTLGHRPCPASPRNGCDRRRAKSVVAAAAVVVDRARILTHLHLIPHPPAPPLTTPSDPTHFEAYPTSPSHNTSTVIDTFITNPFTLSGTFSLTLTPHNSTTNVSTIGTPLLSHEFGWDRRPLEQDADATDPGGDQHERTAYEYGQGSDIEDSAEGSGHRDCSVTDSTSASVSTHASSSADSVPLDNSAEEYIDWCANGCQDSDSD